MAAAAAAVGIALVDHLVLGGIALGVDQDAGRMVAPRKESLARRSPGRPPRLLAAERADPCRSRV